MLSKHYKSLLCVILVSTLSLPFASFGKEDSAKESKASGLSTMETKENFKDSGFIEIPKEFSREQSKEGPKDGVKEVAKEGPKDSAKDAEGNSVSQLPMCKGSYSKVRWTECHGIKREFNGPHFEGQSYDGEFKEGRPNGHGDMRYHDGTRFIGIFEMGVRDGAGAEYAKDGSLIREGFWRAGVLVKTLRTGLASSDGVKENK